MLEAPGNFLLPRSCGCSSSSTILAYQRRRQHFTRRKLPLSRGGIWTCLSCPCRDTKKKKKMGNGKECEVEAHPPISQKGIQSLGGLFFGGPCRPLYLYNLGPC
ncbi:uncharacterized [Tachysurus ichikawai]